MRDAINGPSRIGSFLREIRARVFRITPLRTAYRLLPLQWRQSVGELLAERQSAQTRFPRTPAWGRPIPAPLPLGGCVRPEANGVNILGYLRGQFGLAESARLYAQALIRQGVPVAMYDIELELPHSNDDRSFESYIGGHLPHPVSIVFVNPDYLDRALERIGKSRLKNHHVIGCWFWELGRLPHSWQPALGQVDEVMVASAFIETAVRDASDIPVLKVALPLAEPVDSGLQRVDFGLADDIFVFLVTFDFNSWVARKNPHAALRAFSLAFDSTRQDVCLVVKTSNGHRHPQRLRELLDAVALDPRIVIRDQVLDRGHVVALQRCCDAYVSLHRAEGFGLGLAECMAMGKPVVATGWSGNLEFMDRDNALLIDYRLVAVGHDEYPHEPGDVWAEADIGQAAAAMRRLADDADFTRALGQRASESVRKRLSAQVAASAIESRLNELVANRPR